LTIYSLDGFRYVIMLKLGSKTTFDEHQHCEYVYLEYNSQKIFGTYRKNASILLVDFVEIDPQGKTRRTLVEGIFNVK
jgi:hypothetical protein